MESLGEYLERANFFRITSLLIDTTALRYEFNGIFPGSTLTQRLHDPVVNGTLQTLKQKGYLHQSQEDLLFPSNGVVSSSSFDISLLSLLLRNVCGLQAPSTGWANPPSVWDNSLQADIVRLRLHRNKIQHMSDTSLPTQQFQDSWQDIKQVLLRVGSNIPRFQNDIDELLNNSIDPVKEQIYTATIQHWKQMDNQLEDELQKFGNELESTNQHLEQLEVQMDKTATKQEELDKDVEELSADMKTSKAKQTSTDQQLDELKASQNDQKAIMTRDLAALRRFMLFATLNRMLRGLQVQTTQAMQSLISRSVDFLDRYKATEETFVNTDTFRKVVSYVSFARKNIIVLTGNPGEGKTALAAAKLHRKEKFSREGRACFLVVRKPDDWNSIDWRVRRIFTILIDDIFGAETVNKAWLKHWVTELGTFVHSSSRTTDIVITTRKSILQECLPELTTLEFFTSKDDVFNVSTTNLSTKEKMDILKGHLTQHKRTFEENFLLECVSAFHDVPSSVMEVQAQTLMGFPECSSLFARDDTLYESGSGFFRSPDRFFGKLLTQLVSNPVAFLALVLVWTSKDGIVYRSSLDENPKLIRSIAARFGFQLKSNLCKQVKKQFDFHCGGLLTFTSSNGGYTFSHDGIANRVGVAASKESPKAALSLSKKQFFMEYVTLENSQEKDRFYIQRYLYPELTSKLLNLLICHKKEPCKVLDIWKGQAIERNSNWDIDILQHELFDNQEFVQYFLKHLAQQGFDSCEDILCSTVMEIKDNMYPYELKTGGIALNLFGVRQLYDCDPYVLIKEFLRMKSLLKAVIDRFLQTFGQSMVLVAVSKRDINTVKLLLRSGVSVTENVLYITAYDGSTDIARVFLQHPTCDPNKAGQGMGGNTPLMIASKRGHVETVKCLLDFGADPEIINENQKRALDKAISGGQDDVCCVLLSAGVNVCYKIGSYQRSPLHRVADKGLIASVRHMTEHGANIRRRDKRGHCAIHSAAMQNRADVVRTLIEHDRGQATLRASTYGTKSKQQGMTAFHYAARNGSLEVVYTLLDLGVDPNVRNAFGQTPTYIAASFNRNDVIMALKGNADLGLAEKQGYTPLHEAVYRKNYASVCCLIQCCPGSVHSVDKFGNTPLHVAVRKGYFHIADSLLFSSAKADPGMKNKKGITVFGMLWLAPTYRKKLFMLLKEFDGKKRT